MNDLIANRKVLAICLVALFLMSTLLIVAPVRADSGTLYVDAAGSCDGNSPCYRHPQDAVNAANADDTILVYPGTYDSRVYTTKPPHWGPNDQYAPALIVYKDGLLIEAVEGPSNTVIQSTHNFWSNPVAIQASTGATWDGSKYVGAGVNPTSGSAPNAVAIIASHVTIRGFTFHRHFEGTWATYNTAGVMIGGLFAGDANNLGSDENTVENCVFSDVWHAVYIWHSSGNKIINNNVAALDTNHWAAISTYDGYNDEQINLGHPSENNLISHNILANKGIALGAWTPPTWTSNAGSKVCCNTATSVGVTYSHGPVIVGCNSGGFWHSNTDKVLRVAGVTYAGDTELWTTSGVTVTVNLKAQLSYDGSADGSGVEVDFTVNGTPYSATTSAGGLAGTTAILGPGTYTVETKVTVCPSCEFTDSDPLVVHGFRGIKELVLQDLESLRATVTDKQDGNKLDQAIDHLSKSLAPELWLSETRLDPKRGDKVFQEEKDAVVKLLELMKDKKSTLYGSPKLQDFINRLVNIDRLLASTAINDAAGGDVKKIDKANDELGKGDARVADSHFTDAIEHYRNAWKHALQAV